MGDANPIRTLGDYSKPSHEGYMNTIELPVGNNVVPLRSDNIRLVQNGCSFRELRFEDPIQHLKDFFIIVDSIDLNEEESLDYENPDLEQLLGVMECKVGTLMEKGVSPMGRSESVFGMSSNMMRQLPPEPSRLEAFEDLVVEKLKDEIRAEENRVKKIKKITRYPENEDTKLSSNLKFSETLAKITSLHAPAFISPKSLYVKYVRTIFPSPPLVRKSTFGFKRGTNNNRNIKSRYDAEILNPQSTSKVLISFEENTPPVTYPDEVEEIIGILIEVEPLDETPLEDLGLNTGNHDILFSLREIPSLDEPEP
ncbi:hypothetical protein Tco_0046676 [Tanacetum coccineum]